ncbi:hypothetical protein JOF41_007340 [Saccharothrix coeruleofusca]|uniref:hypothetical protein n=1 Tax=Saccharothrix coeruleofusca TaxID=33919 RepID=UPI001AE32E6B|nr:hypothetical protein [Saccharothrix coeruleofusca]MBP2341086.1 hypothetical protein [Saccharothrix coeruleofusca]
MSAQPGTALQPYGGDLTRVERQLRRERKLALLPPTAGSVTVWAGTGLHGQMLDALAVGGPEMLLVGVGGGALVSALATGVLVGAAVRTGTAQALPTQPGPQGGSSTLALKHLLLGSATSGAALALFGGHPLIVGGYIVAAVATAGRWQLQRMKAWRQLRAVRRELLAHAPAEEAAEESSAGTAVAAEGPGAEVIDAEVVDPVPVAAALPEEVAALIERWRVGVSTQHLPDTRIVWDGQQHAEGRFSFVVEPGPKGTTLSAAQAAREKIPSALRLGFDQDVVFDQPAALLADRAQLRMQIIHLANKAARGARVTPELVCSPDNPGSVRIGAYIDTGDPTWWDFADASGAHSGFVLAGTRMGKSSLFDGLAYRARQLGYLIGFLDPQRGASSPVLAQHADFPVLGAEHTLAYLEWLEAEADLRESWMGAHNLGKITPWTSAPCLPDGEYPDPHCPCGGVVPPGIMAFVDECDQAFRQLVPGSTSTRLGMRYGELAKRMNKLNMGIVAASQIPEQAIFGGSELLRSSLSTRNFLAMRVNANAGATLIPGLPYSPKLLPRTAGRALMCGATSRQMESQLDFMPRREDARDHPAPYAEDLFASLPRARSWAPTTAAARRCLPQQGEDAARQSQQAARERLARLMSGTGAPQPMSTAAAPAPARAMSPATGGIAWPAPVRDGAATPAPTGLAAELLDALTEVPDGEWLTMGDLARRLGRVSVDAETAEVKVAAAELVTALAAQDIVLPGRKRAAGMSTTAGQIRALLQ